MLADDWAFVTLATSLRLAALRLIGTVSTFTSPSALSAADTRMPDALSVAVTPNVGPVTLPSPDGSDADFGVAGTVLVPLLAVTVCCPTGPVTVESIGVTTSFAWCGDVVLPATDAIWPAVIVVPETVSRRIAMLEVAAPFAGFVTVAAPAGRAKATTEPTVTSARTGRWKRRDKSTRTPKVSSRTKRKQRPEASLFVQQRVHGPM